MISPSRNPHWRARLTDVSDLLLVAHTVEDLARANLQLVAVLTDEWDQPHADAAVLAQLVRDAADLLTNADSRVSYEQWLQTAAAAVEGIPAPRRRAREVEQRTDGDPDHGFLGALAPIDPRD